MLEIAVCEEEQADREEKGESFRGETEKVMTNHFQGIYDSNISGALVELYSISRCLRRYEYEKIQRLAF